MAVLNRLHSGSCPRTVKVKQRSPSKGGPKTQLKVIFIGRLRGGMSSQPSQLRRRTLVCIAKRRVEASNTTETCRKCNIAHRELRFVNELLGKMKTASLRHRNGTCSQVLQEKPPQMARTNTQFFGQTNQGFGPRQSLAEPAEGGRDSRRCTKAGWGSGGTFRTATPGRTKARLRRGRSTPIVTDVPLFGLRFRGNRAAIDACRED